MSLEIRQTLPCQVSTIPAKLCYPRCSACGGALLCARLRTIAATHYSLPTAKGGQPCPYQKISTYNNLQQPTTTDNKPLPFFPPPAPSTSTTSNPAASATSAYSLRPTPRPSPPSPPPTWPPSTTTAIPSSRAIPNPTSPTPSSS